jgi:hypothetical protein
VRETAKSAETTAQPEPAVTAGPTQGPAASPSETLLRLQATIGNRATTRLAQRSTRAERQMVQRGVLDALGKGLDAASRPRSWRTPRPATRGLAR